MTLGVVREIMDEFAVQTGLSSDRKPRRYLWTDAFAVCNFLELRHRTGDEKYLRLALRLIDQVHHVLGQHREDDPRTGWISGLDGKEGEKHPTRGGLRIGKELYERSPNEPFDETLEWMRDGQYYHYLTKWMHALNRVSQVTGDLTYKRWGIELAKTVHPAFTYELPTGEKRMYWKMSIDLSRPLVPSMGQHDPLYGFITYNELQSPAPKGDELPDLNSEIADMAEICERMDWTTDDPLGTGELLCDVYKVAQLVVAGRLDWTDFTQTLLESTEKSLETYWKTKPLELPADIRIPFRELGLAIGLRALEKLWALVMERSELLNEKGFSSSRVKSLLQHASLGEKIRGFWFRRENWKADGWTEHPDINMVMLATSLVPDEYLKI